MARLSPAASSMNHMPPEQQNTPPVGQRREWIVLTLLCLLGVGLRLWRIERLSIEHFDEGVYAANVFALLDHNCYPQRHLYAPPLFPMQCELTIGLGGTPDAAIWVNLLYGSLMVPLVWFVSRDAFGTVAATITATLCATSDYHIFFSRSALTDVSLGFWLLLSVWLASRGMRTGQGLTLGGAAIAAALAWSTKYNGWLAVLIPLGGWGLLSIVSGLNQSVPFRERLKTIDREGFLRWSLLAMTAALLWSPVLYDLQSVGGYSVVSANHAMYLRGLAGWWDGFQMHVAYQGWLTTKIGLFLPWLALLAVLPSQTICRKNVCLLGFVLVIATSSVGLALGLASVLSVIGIVWNWMNNSAAPPTSSRLMESMLVVWWVGLTLTTPLYTPYARLSLPWLVSCWLLVGKLAAQCVGQGALTVNLRRAVCLLIIGLVASLALGRPRSWAIDHVWGDRTSLRKSCVQILHEADMGRREMPPSETSACEYAIYIVGEPALFCHLTQLSGDTVITKPASSVMEAAAPHTSGPEFPKFIVTGAHVPAAEIDEAIAAGRIEQIWEQRVLVSDMVALDSASRLQLLSTPLKSIRPPDRTIPVRVFRILE